MINPYIQSFYIDPDEEYDFLQQLVGYNIGTVPFDYPLYEKEHLRFYGTFGKVTGTSKRPDASSVAYTEIYFDVVDIERLWD